MTSSIGGPDGAPPFRLALHQTANNQQQATRQAAPTVSQLQAAILFNTSQPAPTTLSQWRTKDAKASTPMSTAPPISLSGSVFGSTCPRTTGLSAAIPPWIAGSPITANASGLLGSTSTPTACTSGAPNTFPPKGLLLDDFNGAASPCTSKIGNTPMEIGESIESSPPVSDNVVEPRTRAQKARAAASMGQRRSPRLSRAQKQSMEESPVDEPKRAINHVTSVQTPSRQLPSPKDEAPEQTPHPDAPKVMCTSLTDRTDPRNEAIASYLRLLRRLGRSFSLLTQHDYQGAVTNLAKLPYDQLATGRILTWAARAHVDAADYPKAQRIFNELRRLEPWQLLGMDLFSTVLWYLQAERELSHLSNDLLNLDRSAPEPWSATGNCFSLQREHDTAIRFFRRALQVCFCVIMRSYGISHRKELCSQFLVGFSI